MENYALEEVLCTTTVQRSVPVSNKYTKFLWRNTMSNLREEISRRRTFAIISHPDAGKTTLTEKFLLYGGAIAQAGVVKG